jgi:hypothetical protein
MTTLRLLLKKKRRLLRSLAKRHAQLISRASLILRFKTSGAMRSIAFSRLARFLPTIKTLFLPHLRKPRNKTRPMLQPLKDDILYPSDFIFYEEYS